MLMSSNVGPPGPHTHVPFSELPMGDTDFCYRSTSKLKMFLNRIRNDREGKKKQLGGITGK